jgi:opacity protein-like surface antigen
MMKFIGYMLLFISPLALAENGIYVLLDSGFARQTDLPSQSVAEASSVDTRVFPSALHLATGYNHDLTAKWGFGIEAGLGWYGKTTYHYLTQPPTHVRSETSEFLIAGMLHWTPRCDFFMKLGGARVTPVLSGSDSVGRTDTKISLETILGAAYNVNRKLAVTVSYGRLAGRHAYSVNNINQNPPGIDELLLGLRYTFAT